MGKDGIQQKLGRSRAPKVHITFDAAVEGAMRKVELPFVVGILADLSNKPIMDEEGDKIPVKNRKFKEIDRDNFGDIMAAIEPEASVRVDNKLDASGGQVGARLKFRSMDDFRPESVARQFPALKELADLREMLADCKRKIDGNEKLEKTLNAILDKTMQVTGEKAAGVKKSGEI